MNNDARRRMVHARRNLHNIAIPSAQEPTVQQHPSRSHPVFERQPPCLQAAASPVSRQQRLRLQQQRAQSPGSSELPKPPLAPSPGRSDPSLQAAARRVSNPQPGCLQSATRPPSKLRPCVQAAAQCPSRNPLQGEQCTIALQLISPRGLRASGSGHCRLVGSRRQQCHRDRLRCPLRVGRFLRVMLASSKPRSACRCRR